MLLRWDERKSHAWGIFIGCFQFPCVISIFPLECAVIEHFKLHMLITSTNNPNPKAEGISSYIPYPVLSSQIYGVWLMLPEWNYIFWDLTFYVNILDLMGFESEVNWVLILLVIEYDFYFHWKILSLYEDSFWVVLHLFKKKCNPHKLIHFP